MLSVFSVNGTFAAGAYDPGQPTVRVAQALLPSEWSGVSASLTGVAPAAPIIDWYAMGVGSDPRWNTYPASVYPMGASFAKGVNDLVAAVRSTPVGQPKALVSYSQGSLSAATFWRDHVLNPSGDCRAYLNDFVAAVNWGNPMRCPGIAYGNTYAGWAQQSGGGISGPDNLTAQETPPWWYDFTDPNDLFTDCPVGTAAGADETMIYNLIVTKGFGGTLQGLLRVIESVVEQFNQPLIEVIGLATAIWNGLRFVAAGPAAGHYTYNVAPAISYLQSVALRYA